MSRPSVFPDSCTHICVGVHFSALMLGEASARKRVSHTLPLVAHCHAGLTTHYRGTDRREQALEHLAPRDVAITAEEGSHR